MSTPEEIAREIATNTINKHLMRGIDSYEKSVALIVVALIKYGNARVEEAAKIFDVRAEEYALEGESADVFAVDFAEDAANRIRALKEKEPGTPTRRLGDGGGD